MSSRNKYLSADDRRDALALVTGLRAAMTLFERGERRAGVLRKVARGPVEAISSAIDYVDVADADSLRVYGDEDTTGERAVVAVAARVGATRLIDNVVLGEDNLPQAAP
jgi:pantoate--beta-alanine ligase